MKTLNYKRLIISLVLPQLAGLIGSVFTASSIPTWYRGLIKPALSPANWLFAPVWITLYFLMGISLFLVWKSFLTDPKKRRKAIILFFIQLFLNAIWSIIFFGLHSPFWAFVEIIVLWLAILWTIIVFYKISRPTLFFLLPYLLWVSFAAYLNYSIWTLNQEKPIACTMDVKLCPDGSYVARVPPECDFAPCPETRTIELYYYNSELDKDESGNIACSRNGLAAVEREILITQTPIQDTIKLLLLGQLTEEERNKGITSEYPLLGFSLKSASLENGVLTLEFDDPNNEAVGGSCRVGILWFQIEATAKQFPEVEKVDFLPEEIFQP